MVRLGLINCDPLSPQVIEQYGDYPTMFANFFASTRYPITWTVFDAVNQALPENVHDFDAYVITGSRYGVLDPDPWIQMLLTFIQQLWKSQIKTIGICFGHQAIAQALGGQVNRAANGWGLGVSKATILEQKPWMKPWQPAFQVCVSHQDQVLKLPPHAQCLAKTNHSPIAMMELGEIFLSFQGHPEFNQTYARYLIEKRKGLFEAEIYENFISSLSLSIDTELLANWVVNFIVLPKR
ncbi:GMP synthase [Legionella sp. W05-934-2]|jgi:GMP synthase-like glutamine amidotransferase|uniref:glutamine amidotransferase-related protein n=1 Tax=Legionella sp. W05-934-2 TaxID=1198649 RepID=UPI0034617C33